MNFRRELQIGKFKSQINIKDKVMLIGSCFTEHLGDKMNDSGFKVRINPNGILFNPISIVDSVTDYISNKKFQEQDIFFHDEWWMSWKHHSRFIDKEKSSLLEILNNTTNDAHYFLLKADWLILTLGTAWIYQIDSGQVVANCHKVSSDKFRKRLLDIDELSHNLDNLISRLSLFNPDLKIVFTISPVRHLRDGFIENNRGKAVLIHCTHQLIEKYHNVFYFPAYELVMDDLRDYRFFGEDMVHPNHLSTEYVWNKFEDSFIDEYSRSIIKEINLIKAARLHKPFQPHSIAHQKFLQVYLQKTLELKAKYPFLELSEELEYFNRNF